MPFVNDEFFAREFSNEAELDVRLKYSGFRVEKLQGNNCEFKRHFIWCPNHFALVLDANILDGKLMNARIAAPEKSPPFSAIDEKVFLVGDRHHCIAGIAEPIWVNANNEIEALLFLLSSDGFSGIGVSFVRSGVLQMSASPPIAIEWNPNTKRALVICRVGSTLEINGARFELKTGKHELQLA